MAPQKKETSSPTPSPSRRSLFSWAWVGLGSLALAETAWLVFSFLKPRQPAAIDAAERVVVAGPEELFEPGSVTAFPQGKFYLARLADGGFLALGRECTHLGCTVTWSQEEGRFLCPCHASAFDLHGDVLNPPAPRSLDLYAVSIENRAVKVDVAKRTRRSRFEASQVTYV
jgi:cytochrome b6-f complex iron-sulfur subunit